MRCTICQNVEGNASCEAREMMFGTRETFVYFQCAKCGCLQIAEVPPDMSRYYPADYYSFRLSPEGLFTSRLKNLLKRPRDRFAVTGEGIIGRSIYAFLPNENLTKLRPARIRTNSRILEVGCGSGTMLYTLRAAGFTRVLGVDPFIEKDIAYANGLRILKGFVRDVEGEWDLVMFEHSLEHIPDQVETMRAAAGVLTEGGRCWLRTPTVSSCAWEHYGTNWVQLDAPRHLFLHSVESMELLGREAGLRLDEVVYDSDEFQFWGSEQYAKDIPLKSERSYAVDPARSIFSAEEIATFRTRADKLNREKRGDQAVFHFVKM